MCCWLATLTLRYLAWPPLIGGEEVDTGELPAEYLHLHPELLESELVQKDLIRELSLQCRGTFARYDRNYYCAVVGSGYDQPD